MPVYDCLKIGRHSNLAKLFVIVYSVPLILGRPGTSDTDLHLLSYFSTKLFFLEFLYLWYFSMISRNVLII